MKLDNSSINFSKGDVSQEVNLPDSLTPDLAEIVGIILGDGHIDHNKKYASTILYALAISGSLTEDFAYYQDKINPIFNKLFNKSFCISSRRNDELIVRLNSKAITSFFVNLGIKSGNKVDCNEIPSLILDSEDSVKRAFLRGVFDTEGSITFKKDYFMRHSKPLISLKMKSLYFIFQLINLLESFGLNPKIYGEEYFDLRSGNISIRHRIDLAGKKKLKKYLQIIGFRNPRHLTKIAIWRKFGFYPPRLKYQQRLNILNGELDIKSIYP